MAISLQEAIDNDLISKALREVIPNNGYCYCGSELYFTDSLRQLYCSNKQCYLKMASRLFDMAKGMGVQGWDKETCIKVCKDFKLKSPYQVFLLENIEYNSVEGFSEKIKAICDPEKRKLKLWQIVKLSGIPSIETIAYKLFDGYNSIEQAYEDIKKYQVPFIADKLGLKNADTGVIAVNVYNTLIEYETELLFGATKFIVEKDNHDKVLIAIAGAVNGFHNKYEFINYINMRYKGKIRAMLMNSIVENLNVLISDGDIDNRKYKIACKLNAKAKEKAISENKDSWHEIMITNSKDYLEYLENKYEVTE